MTVRNRRLAVMFGLMLLVLAVGAQAQTPNLTPTDLGALPGASTSFALAVNAVGQVVGISGDAPFVWQGGVMTRLDMPDWAQGCYPWAINSTGQIVGYCQGTVGTLNAMEAVLWTPGKKGTWTRTMLGFPDGYSSSVGLAINDAGQVLGAGTSTQTAFGAACIWEDGAWTTLKNGSSEIVIIQDFQWRFHLNQKGQVLGVDSAGQLLLWDAGTVYQLRVSAVRWAFLNDAGQVVGVSEPEFGQQFNFAFDVSGGVGNVTGGTWPVRDVGSTPGLGYQFVGVNDSGTILLVSVPATIDDSIGIATVPFDGAWTRESVLTGLTFLGIVDGAKEIKPAWVTGVYIDADGDVSGSYDANADPDTSQFQGFYASSSTGVLKLNDLTGQPQHNVVTAMSETGMIVGMAATSSLESRAAAWTAPLSIGTATLAVGSKGKTILVTVPITNPAGSLTATDVIITSASLDGVIRTASLPTIKSLAPGETVPVTIKFSTTNLSTGPQELTIVGSSSLGAFSGTQTVTVPSLPLSTVW